MSSKAGAKKRLWEKLTGVPGEFSMEHKAFNYVLVISFTLLLCSLFVDLIIGQLIMSLVIFVLFLILGICYYLSRYKKNYNGAIVIYAVSSYIALILNYFQNSGSSGPTLCIFFVTFTFFILFASPRQYPVWLILHALIAVGLLGIEYCHPEWVPDSYPGRGAHYLDVATTYVLCIVIIFAASRYLRNYYDEARVLAEERSGAISEQNKQIVAQNQLLATVNDEKNKIFSIVSHDLKGPLDSIRGYLELLTGDLLGADEKVEIEQELLTQTKYTSDLLLNLLSWAKTQMQGVTVRPESLVLRDLVETATNDKKALAARKGIKLTHSISPDIEVVGDKDMMNIVLRNLVNNALKFTNKGGEVIIKVLKKGGIAEVSVKDTGIGIAADKQGEIFTMKTRSTFGTGNEKGIGLGLIMCKEFMEYQHGSIRFESEPGVGTTFYTI